MSKVTRTFAAALLLFSMTAVTLADGRVQPHPPLTRVFSSVHVRLSFLCKLICIPTGLRANYGAKFNAQSRGRNSPRLDVKFL